MFCQKCGKENLEEAGFCGFCGAPLAPTARAPVSAPPATSGAQPVSNGLTIGICIASLFIPLVGIIMGGIYMSDANPAKKSAGKLWLIVGAAVMVFYCALFSAGSLGNL